ncbi:MAG: class I SAM-dependent RNA methyltransferase, partial [Bdellovibrionota bacterium]
MRRKKLREPATREILEIRIADLSRGGAGVGRDASGRAIFVPLTAPGDLARVEIVGTEKRYAQARLLELLESSPERREPRCRVFGRCGGCQWQHLDYSLQWRTKVSGVRHALTRVQVPLAGPLSEFPAERIFEYRNRVQLRGQGRELGFYAAGSNEVVPIERCEIARPEINAALDAVRAEGAKLARPFKVEVEVLADTKIRSTWNSAHAASGFRQVHDEQNELLKKWVSERIPDGALVLDLYGGQGNLTRGLAP